MTHRLARSFADTGTTSRVTRRGRGRPRVLIAARHGCVLGCLVLAACGGGGRDDATDTTTVASTSSPPNSTTSTVPTTTTTVAPATSTTSTTTSSTTTTTLVSPPAEPPPTTTFVSGVPVFDAYEPRPGLDGIAALTGLPADESITQRAILAVKVDNVAAGRPQWGLEAADVVFEENVEQATRFVALFHSADPDRVGPVRSARTGDIDVLSGLNRPILAWSGGNPGVTRWIGSASDAGLLVDFTAQRNPCYARTSAKRAPHNLLLDPACARAEKPLGPGAARPLWAIDDGWTIPAGSQAMPSGEFEVEMDGNRVTWRWDEAAGVYLRFQNGNPHLTQSGTQLSATNVIELYSPHLPSPVDARSPNPLTTGRDRAVIHRAGTTIEAVWERRSAIDPFVFVDAGSGGFISLATGTTFVEITRNPAFG